LKESLKKKFSSNISEIPKFILNKEMEHRKKKRKKKHRKKEEKLQKSLSFEKGEFNILRGENVFKTFLCESISSPLFYHFKNSFLYHLKILDSFGTIP
jgi:hypothetical protein